jgi:hypothetical protein
MVTSIHLCVFLYAYQAFGFLLLLNDLLSDYKTDRQAFLPGKPLLWLCRHNQRDLTIFVSMGYDTDIYRKSGKLFKLPSCARPRRDGATRRTGKQERTQKKGPLVP